MNQRNNHQELVELQRKIIELEKENLRRTEIEQEKAKIEHSLRERVKELNCLYGITNLIVRHGHSIEKILQGVTDLLPAAWQYPEITCARVTFEGKEYVTPNFKTSQWRQATDIFAAGKKEGLVEVYYLEEKPVIDEGPFLREERLLIDTVAQRISRASERIRAEKQLEVERVSLKNMNIALREVLTRVEDEKKEIGKAIQANVNKVIMPILLALEAEIPANQKIYLKLLENNLKEILSPFTKNLSKEFMSLTPAEVQICYIIKQGLPTKEIANLRGISIATVNRHREHIRKKLGIANANINLITFLDTFMEKLKQ
jgi:hypothetical protein